MHHSLTVLVLLPVFLMFACAGDRPRATEAPAPLRSAGPTFAIALHGGAGTISKGTPPAMRDEYTRSLSRALDLGLSMLRDGRSALDTAESVVAFLEDDPLFNAGKGGVYTAHGTHELDASIMNGTDMTCGAVAGVRTVKNPIRLARLVMTNTRHIIMSGDGAEAFADSVGVERVDPSYFETPRRRRALDEFLRENPDALPPDRGTVGCVVLDSAGNLAGATSTGGMTGKRPGRIGDSPIIGAGNYADRTVAVSGTGKGEEFIRLGIARDVAARMAYKNISLAKAAHEVVFQVLKPGDGGVIAVSARGEIAMPFNTPGMFRAAGDSNGRYTVAIWEDAEAVPPNPR